MSSRGILRVRNAQRESGLPLHVPGLTYTYLGGYTLIHSQ